MDVRLQLGMSSLVVEVSKFLVEAERGSWLRFSKACLVVALVQCRWFWLLCLAREVSDVDLGWNAQLCRFWLSV